MNLKKSWHPSTLRNQERVWKAQQQDESEKKKVEVLRKELQAQREKEEFQNIADRASGSTESKTKLEWMYKGVSALVDREDYLLGRKVDKTFDVIKAAEEASETTQQDGEKCEGLPSQLFKRGETKADFTPVDMAVKVREDPLYIIKKQEYESKKQLLSNPVKMKMLQEMINKEKCKRHKKSKKKKKKNKKNPKRGDSTSDSSPERDIRIPINKNKEESKSFDDRQRGSPNRDRGKSANPYSRFGYRENSRLGRRRHSVERKSNRSLHRYRGSQRNRSRSPQQDESVDRTRSTKDITHRRERNSERTEHSQPEEPNRNGLTEAKDRRSPEPLMRNRPRDYESVELFSRSPSPMREGYGLIKVKETSEDVGYAKKDYRLLLEDRRQKEERERLELKERCRNRNSHKMTKEEKEARLREMQEDAVIREAQRQEYVRRHTKCDAVVVEGYQESGFRGAEMFSKAVDKSNVERRIKSNLKGLKRANRIMDSNFLRK